MAAPPYPRAYSVSNSGGPSSSGGYHLPPPPPIAGSKRAHDETFRPNPEITRYQNGAREQEPLDDRDGSASVFKYRRADGTFEFKLTDEVRGGF